jgi:hyperosmotically inducible protein
VKDVSLEGKVKSMLHENKDTRGADVHVTASHGIVTLTGTVESKMQAIRAEQVAANVYGVKRVRDQLHYPAHEGSAGTASSSASE